MKRKYILLALTIVIMGIICTACGKNADSKPTEANEVQSKESDTTEESGENAKEIGTSNQINAIEEEQKAEEAKKRRRKNRRKPIMKMTIFLLMFPKNGAKIGL